MVDEPLLMLRLEVGELLKRTGHQLTLEDFPALLKLYNLAKAINQPGVADEMVFSVPVRAGNVLLFPLTLGRARWVEEIGLQWFTSVIMSDLMFGFVLSRTYTLDDLWAFSTRRECKKAVKRWWKKADCTYLQLRAGLSEVNTRTKSDQENLRLCRDCRYWTVEDRCTNEDVLAYVDGDFRPKGLFSCDSFKPVDKHKRAYYGPLIALLCREYGNTPQYWLWEAPIEEVNSLYLEFLSRIDAEEAASRRASNAKATPPPPTMHARRMRELRLLKNSLRDKWQTETST